MLEKLNPEQMDHVLHSQVVGRIACAAAGRVYLVSETSMPGGNPEIHQPLIGGPVTLVTFRIHIKEKSGRYEKR